MGEVAALLSSDPSLVYNRHNYWSRRGFTLLMTAAVHGQACLVDVLLDWGAEIDARCESDGRTALMWACEEGHRAVVTALLRRGASIDARDARDGATALHIAAARGHAPLVRELVRHHEQRRQASENRRSLTPYGKGGRTSACNAVDVVNRRGQSALWLACASDEVECAAVLVLDAGADARIADRRGRTPMAVARTRRHAGCVGFFEVCDEEERAGGWWPLLKGLDLADGSPVRVSW